MINITYQSFIGFFPQGYVKEANYHHRYCPEFSAVLGIRFS